MKLRTKFAAILAGLLISVGSALATVCTTPATVGGWTNFTDVAPCDADTTWTFVGSSPNISAAGLRLTENLLSGIITYALTFDFTSIPGGQISNGTAFIDYTVLIIKPLEFWTSFSLDSTCPSGTPDCNVTQTVNVVTRTSLNGAPSAIGPLSGILLSVHETFTAGPNGILTGATNTFTLRTAAAPEPMSLALLGIGLAAVGFVSRRRKIQ